MKEKNTKKMLIVFVAIGIVMLFSPSDKPRIVGLFVGTAAIILYAALYITGPYIKENKREKGNTSLA